MPKLPIALSSAARRMLVQSKVDPDLLKEAHTPLYAHQLTAVIDLANLMGVPASSVVRAGVQHLLDTYDIGSPAAILAQALERQDNALVAESQRVVRAERKMAALPDTSMIYGRTPFVQETTLSAEWVVCLRDHAAVHYPDSAGTGITDLCKEATGMLYRYLRIVGFTPRIPYGHSLALLVPLTNQRKSVLLRAALLLYIKHYKLKPH